MVGHRLPDVEVTKNSNQELASWGRRVALAPGFSRSSLGPRHAGYSLWMSTVQDVLYVSFLKMDLSHAISKNECNTAE